MSLRPATPRPLAPLPLLKALLYFGLSALLFRGCVYTGLPALLQAGYPPFWAFLASYALGLTLLLLATLLALRREGYPLDGATFQQRLRFRPLSRRAWGWTLGLFLVGFLLTGPLVPSAQWLARLPAFQSPAFLPAVLNPLTPHPTHLTQFMGQPLAGQWWVGGCMPSFCWGSTC